MPKINLLKSQLNRIPLANTYVTKREYRIIELYCQGRRQKQIAWSLRISPKTVDGHMRNIKERLNADTMQQAIAIFAASELPRKRA